MNRNTLQFLRKWQIKSRLILNNHIALEMSRTEKLCYEAMICSQKVKNYFFSKFNQNVLIE